MTKTQFNFALPTDLLSFVASKNDNSASTDPNMPATKSPDFYYEGVKADNTTQSVSLYYDVSDSYAKKLVVDGVTTNLDLVNADDAVTNISLEGSTNPLTFLFQTMDENVGYIWDAVTETMVAIQVCGSTSCSPIIADASSFETIYTDITALPAPAPLTILFTTPNPLTGLGEVVKSFTLEMDVVGGYLNYTFVREDKSSFTMSLEDAAIPIVNNGITLTKMLTIIDSGVTIKYFGSANMTASLTQMSGYIADAVNGTFTTTEPQPIDLSGMYNPAFDGFRIILITSLLEIEIGGNTIVTNPSDSGVVITTDMTRKALINKHLRRLKQISHKASAKFINPLRNLGKKLKNLRK